eukprot:scaffold9982_cov63-Phaeocystis_antarctica.AAC.4
MPVSPLSKTHSNGRLDRKATPGNVAGAPEYDLLVVGDERADVLDAVAPAARVDLVGDRVRVRVDLVGDRVRVRVDLVGDRVRLRGQWLGSVVRVSGSGLGVARLDQRQCVVVGGGDERSAREGELAAGRVDAKGVHLPNQAEQRASALGEHGAIGTAEDQLAADAPARPSWKDLRLAEAHAAAQPLHPAWHRTVLLVGRSESGEREPASVSAAVGRELRRLLVAVVEWHHQVRRAAVDDQSERLAVDYDACGQDAAALHLERELQREARCSGEGGTAAGGSEHLRPAAARRRREAASRRLTRPTGGKLDGCETNDGAEDRQEQNTHGWVASFGAPIN